MRSGTLAAALLSIVVACGDNAGTPDATPPRADSAPTIDAAPPDAPPAPVFTGTISVAETAVLNPGTSGTFFGQGVVLGAAINDVANLGAPVMEEQPGQPIGCKAWMFNAAQAGASAIGADEGVLQVTMAGTNAPTYPACAYSAGAGYVCAHTNTVSTGGTIAAGPAAGTATLTDLDVTYNAGNTTNRFVRISGATNAGNNGAFPIVGLGGANTIVYANPAFVAENIPAAGSHVNLALAGPTPSAPDPAFMANNFTATIALTAGGGNHIPTFTSDAGDVGDDFVLETAELNKLNAIPTNGAALTLSCTAVNCPVGSATASVVQITTTDAPTAGLSPFAMPAVATSGVRIQCAALGSSTVTVPAAYMALLQAAAGTTTRTRASFSRLNLLDSPVANVSLLAGHAVVGFTNPPPN